MSAKSKVPQIRFSGSKEAIYPKKLKEIVLSNTYGPRFNANDYDISGNVKTIRGTDISINGNILYEQVPTAKLDNDFINDHILEDGDLVMITTADCGLSGIFQEQKDKFICSAYAVKITFNKKLVFPPYIKYFFQTSLAKSEVNKFIRKATVSNLPASDILKITHHLPLKEEQKNIAVYFDLLYKLIEQKEKKYQKLKQLKKAMLNTMFPKDGADIPQIRFKGFSGKWEEKTFGKIFDYERPDNYIVKSTEYSNDLKIPVLTANKAFILGYTNENNTFNKPSIIFDDFTLDFKLVDFPYMVKSSALKILTIKDKKLDNLNFIYNLLHTIKIEILGHARHYISVVQPTSVYVPKIDEQIKIGNYFQKLDKLIELQKKELEKLKNIKKASLDKMFV